MVVVPLCYQPYWRALSVRTVPAGAVLIGQSVDLIHLKVRKSPYGVADSRWSLASPAVHRLSLCSEREELRENAGILSDGPRVQQSVRLAVWSARRRRELLRKVENSLFVVNKLARFL
jgi:hypothetical protein